MFTSSRQAARHCTPICKQYFRSVHTVPRLTQKVDAGINGLYSQEQTRMAWFDYQDYLVKNLTLLTNGTANETRSPYQILLNTAKQPVNQHVFHYASQAHNNHFFFEQLANKEEAQLTRPSRFIMDRLIRNDIPDISVLKEKMLTLAENSVGQGWVFLVETPYKSFQIIKCNNDGTPYYYGKNQSLDLNGGVDESAYQYLENLKERAAKRERDYNLPILAISFWDQSYIKDYGLGGKKEYLERVWDCIDWNVINKRFFQV
ncbi:uncharacterized protein J8A68_003429 [[Candida] subhashii]|uniref:Manganese/iron superoxide dismutase C-terminal domain-containing protein n=1 Tax=[Candida] subhashii TaxID=561895 RepID=A0A8J5UME6_9ASCO|nr:uncharacterized protein J8A68_003429 [[Candida] subhashii]KAG7663047.1 hypothetical protein J8A68_003429 [[Candida] subhashii]